MCNQSIEENIYKSSTSEQRLDFEIEQIQDEGQEAQELIHLVREELESLLSHKRTLDEDMICIESQMKPLQVAVSIILPPGISGIDMELGRIQEQKKQLERIKHVLQIQDSLYGQISEFEREIEHLETDVKRISEEIDFGRSSSFLVEKINFYLREIQQQNPKSWNQGEIGLRLGEKDFMFTYGDGKNKISSLAATMMLYFLPAYNYGLLSLSNKEEFHYPGLSILEFPASITDGSNQIEIRNHENFMLQPFINLLMQEGMENTQVIAVGNAFEGLDNVHRVELKHIWRVTT